jgi:hypothetical protein
VVGAVAELVVEKAKSSENPARELRWTAFLAGPEKAARPRAASRKRAAKA